MTEDTKDFGKAITAGCALVIMILLIVAAIYYGLWQLFLLMLEQIVQIAKG